MADLPRDRDRPRRASTEGPQGTQRYSRDQVARLLEEAEQSATEDNKAQNLPQLVGINGPIAGRWFPLRSDRVVVGRSPVCDIRIHESSLSAEHARFTRHQEGWQVTNLLSTNGVFVNRRKVFSRLLADGDRIQLGRLEFRYSDPDADGSGRTTASGLRFLFGTAFFAGLAGLIALAIWLL